MKNNNSLSKFKQVLQLSGFKDVTEKSEAVQLLMKRGDLIIVVIDEDDGLYRVSHGSDEKGLYGDMSAGNESKAMDYIREILMEVA